MEAERAGPTPSAGSTASVAPRGAGDDPGGTARYILLTECLQNDFFLNPDCRLALPDVVAARVLLSRADLEAAADFRRMDAEMIERGPLGSFLESIVRQRPAGPLHLVNIRDWHSPSESYDLERRRYGSHCEVGTWGAQYLRGYERYLEPENGGKGGEGPYFRKGPVHVHHIRSDSVFDFRPRVPEHGHRGVKYPSSRLENLLDILLLGSDEQVDRLKDCRNQSDLVDLAGEVRKKVHEEVDDPGALDGPPQVYVAVIGVYTDLKILTVLAGIRTRYDLENLAVSDTLTASPTLERHLMGLDFCSKLLGVEVIHGVSDLARFMGAHPPTPPDRPDSDVVTAEDFSKYQSFFQDKQNVLAYQDEKLHDYLRLTEHRSIDVYERIKRTNTLLIWSGTAFLGLTFLAAVLNLFWPKTFDWKVTVVTGGLGLAQLVTAFFSRPMRDLQRNLTNLASFKMLLESHSLKTALARFHLTTPQVLRELGEEQKSKEAQNQITVLEQEIRAIQTFDDADFAALAQLSVPMDGMGTPNGAATTADGVVDLSSLAPGDPAVDAAARAKAAEPTDGGTT